MTTIHRAPREVGLADPRLISTEAPFLLPKLARRGEPRAIERLARATR